VRYPCHCRSREMERVEDECLSARGRLLVMGANDAAYGVSRPHPRN
jgi:hypothetical protein